MLEVEIRARVRDFVLDVAFQTNNGEMLALFGPSGEHNWGPWGDGHAVVASPYLCRPCGQDGCLGGKRSDCLGAITADEVMQAVREVVGQSQVRDAFERFPLPSGIRAFGRT